MSKLPHILQLPCEVILLVIQAKKSYTFTLGRKTLSPQRPGRGRRIKGGLDYGTDRGKHGDSRPSESRTAANRGQERKTTAGMAQSLPPRRGCRRRWQSDPAADAG